MTVAAPITILLTAWTMTSCRILYQIRCSTVVPVAYRKVKFDKKKFSNNNPLLLKIYYFITMNGLDVCLLENLYIFFPCVYVSSCSASAAESRMYL